MGELGRTVAMEWILVSRRLRYRGCRGFVKRWLIGGAQGPRALAFNRKLTGSTYSVDRAEAIRATGNMELAAAKPLLAAILKSVYAERSERVKVGRKHVNKVSDSWRRHNGAVPAAVARLTDSQAFEAVFSEAAFASPKARKMLMPMLLKAYKEAVAVGSKSDRVQPRTPHAGGRGPTA